MNSFFASTSVLLAAEAYHYLPFRNPLPIWGYWYLLLLPLCLGVSIVYKSIKSPAMRQVPRDAARLFVAIIGGIILAAIALALLLRWIGK